MTIQNHTKLQYLIISKTTAKKLTILESCPSFLHLSAETANLSTLIVRNSSVEVIIVSKNIMLQALELDCKNLKQISLRGCTSLEEVKVTTLPSLSTCNIDGSQLSDDILTTLFGSNGNNVKDFKIDKCDHIGVINFSNSNLERLQIVDCCNLYEISGMFPALKSLRIYLQISIHSIIERY
jgi:hypothetical protein